ncbi:hypothetical protein TcWFU_006418 [Taenia crassiceps]|uniref:Uncharacterized protein n=1 Tax=Taenia crassiceps TaxID=6207 RepID=A0ABR4QHM5_9CEST
MPIEPIIFRPCLIYVSLCDIRTTAVLRLANTFQPAVAVDDGFYVNREDAALVECWKHGDATDFSVLMKGGVVPASTTPTTPVLLDHCKQESVPPGCSFLLKL